MKGHQTKTKKENKMQWITKQFNKAVPVIELVSRWVVRTAFELLKLAALAYTVMHVIGAVFIVETVIAAIIVFSASYIPRKCR